jgi:hypothetical protein
MVSCCFERIFPNKERKMSPENRRFNRSNKLIMVLFICLAFCLLVSPAQAKYSGGTGEPNDPFLIATAEDLNSIGLDPCDWDKHFKMIADINMADYTGEEFNLIKSSSTPFTGVFDGNNHSISNLTYRETFPWPILYRSLDNMEEGDYPIILPPDVNIIVPPDTNIFIPFPTIYGGDGLFGYVDGVDAEIKNLTLIDPNIQTFGGAIGALVGHLHNGTIDNCIVEGGIVRKLGGIFSFSSYIGGLVGNISDGNVSHCYISNCYSINRSWGGSAGGLTARNEAGTISNCCANNPVVIDGSTISGGLVTVNFGSIVNSFVNGSKNECGLVAHNLGTISNCYATGNAQSAGLVCVNEGTISDSYAEGAVNGNNYAGGLVSINRGTISNCYATSAVDGNNYIGGLVAYNFGIISDCYVTGHVTGDVNVGALVAYDDGGQYASCFWDSDVNPDVNGIGNTADPNVISETTENMQSESTFTDAAWDFITPIWKMCIENDYPKLWWQECPESPLEATVKIVPKALHLNSSGKWITCYIWLPEDCDVVDVNSHSVMLGNEIEPEWIWIEEKEQIVMTMFLRSKVQKLLIELALTGEVELIITGELIDGTGFEGKDTIKAILKGKK